MKSGLRRLFITYASCDSYASFMLSNLPRAPFQDGCTLSVNHFFIFFVRIGVLKVPLTYHVPALPVPSLTLCFYTFHPCLVTSLRQVEGYRDSHTIVGKNNGNLFMMWSLYLAMLSFLCLYSILGLQTLE